MANIPKFYDNEMTHEYTFSVCSLVRDMSRYDKLLKSFEAFGFTSENTEFLVADNRNENQFDGYNYMRRLFPECKGKYILFGHEDIEAIDNNADELLARLEELEKTQPKWTLAGVVGGRYRPLNNNRTHTVWRLTDSKNDNVRTSVDWPARMDSFDECFMIMRRDRPVFNSFDLDGFHYYGVDICMINELMGGQAWAVDWHMRHEGLTNFVREEYDASRNSLINKYRKYFPGRIVHTTMGRVDFGGGWLQGEPRSNY